MNNNNGKNLRGFTDHFANEFVLPQIQLWKKNFGLKIRGASGLKAEYYQGMSKAVNDLEDNFSPPYDKHHPGFPLHEVVLTLDEVERLKGIIGDNYHYFKKKVTDKKELKVSFMDTSQEEKEIEHIDLYLDRVAPSLGDSRERNFYIPFENLNVETKVISQEQQKIPLKGIFLSHSHKDKEIVRWFRNVFEEEGIKVWFDESEILPGDSIIQKISDGMKKSKYVAVFVSENLNLENMSQYVGWEVSMGKVKDLEDKTGRLIPVLIASSVEAKLPQEMLDKNYADFRDQRLDKSNPEFQRLLKKIKQ